MKTTIVLLILAALCILSPVAATATTYIPTEFGILWWTGSGGPGCEEFPAEASASYTVELAPSGSDAFEILMADIQHLGVGVEHVYEFELPDIQAYDFRVTCYVDLAGSTFWASCVVSDVRIFTVCPGECGARAE
ncbi:MAG: hypothetical protein OCU12_07115 [Methanophagales archaeon]|nr:hypothetical protein [Methanophagales archaeon]